MRVCALGLVEQGLAGRECQDGTERGTVPQFFVSTAKVGLRQIACGGSLRFFSLEGINGKG